MIAAIVTILAMLVVVLVVVAWMSQPSGVRPSEVVYVDESHWDPWGWWPAGPWTPHWNPHPFHPRPHRPLGPGGEHRPHRPLGPGGERRLMGSARRG